MREGRSPGAETEVPAPGYRGGTRGGTFAAVTPRARVFTEVRHVKPSPIPDKLGTPIVSVVAEGDYVIVTQPRTNKDSKDPTKTYTTTWFDMWRFVDGKADEHWDPATR